MSPIDFSVYHGFIFDMDGTLVNSMPAHLEAWRDALKNQNAPIHIDFVAQRGGMPTAKIALAYNQAFNLSLNETQILTDKRIFFDGLWPMVKPIDATVELLINYQGEKKMALATGADSTNMQRIMRHLRLDHYFSSMTCADDVTTHKPEPETFLTAAKQLGLSPSCCLVFEDTQVGLQAAQNAKMDCVLIKDGQLDSFHPYDSGHYAATDISNRSTS